MGAGGGDGRHPPRWPSPPALWIGHRRLGLARAWPPSPPCSPSSSAATARSPLTQPWNPYLPLVAWVVVLLAAWAVLCGDHRDARAARRRGHVLRPDPRAVPAARRRDGRPRPSAAVVVAATRAARRRRAARRGAAWPSPSASASCCGCRRWSTSSRNDAGQHPPARSTTSARRRRRRSASVDGVRIALRHLDAWTGCRRPARRRPAGSSTTPRRGGAPSCCSCGSRRQPSSPGADRLPRASLRALHVVVGVALLLGAVSTARIFGRPWYYLTLWAWGIDRRSLVGAVGVDGARPLWRRAARPGARRAPSPGRRRRGRVAVVATLGDDGRLRRRRRAPRGAPERRRRRARRADVRRRRRRGRRGDRARRALPRALERRRRHRQPRLRPARRARAARPRRRRRRVLPRPGHRPPRPARGPATTPRSTSPPAATSSAGGPCPTPSRSPRTTPAPTSSAPSTPTVRARFVDRLDDRGPRRAGRRSSTPTCSACRVDPRLSAADQADLGAPDRARPADGRCSSPRRRPTTTRRRCDRPGATRMPIVGRRSRTCANEDGERRHPWEVARARFFRSLIADHVDVAALAAVLDVGAGDGWFAGELAGELPATTAIMCWDVNYRSEDLATPTGARHHAHRRRAGRAVRPRARPRRARARRRRRGASSPTRSCRLARAGTRRGVSVPAHPRLFSDHDRMLEHRPPLPAADVLDSARSATSTSSRRARCSRP